MKKIKMPFLLKIENNIIDNLYQIFDENNFKNTQKVIIGIDSTIYNLYKEKIVNQIESFFKEVKIVIINTNDLEIAFDISKLVLKKDYEIIIGIGGGKVLDVCKYASYISKKIFISIPTAIAHDGVASPIAVLKCEDEVKSFGCSIPYGIIVDLNIVSSAPISLIKAGIGDTLSNYTAIKDWKLSAKKNNNKIDDFAILLSELAVKSVLNHQNKDLNNLDFIKTATEACIISGIAMNLAGNSSPCSGSEHLISHSMDKLKKNNLHGIQVGVSAIVSNYLHGENPKIIIDFLKNFDLPTTFSELGFDFNDFLYIMKNAKSTRPNRYTILDEINLDDDYLKQIYIDCFE